MCGAVGKPSINSAKLVGGIGPEARRSNLGQGEVSGNTDGGPNRLVVQFLRMT